MTGRPVSHVTPPERNPVPEREAASANARTLETVLQAMPYPHLIRDIDLHTQPDVLRFTWRGARYRVSEHLHVEEVEGDVLVGSDLAILMERTLRLAHCEIVCNRTVLPA